MKVRFNKVVKQNDTICLPLYKRVYPKLLQDGQAGADGGMGVQCF